MTVFEALRLVPSEFVNVPKIYAEYSVLYTPLASTGANIKGTVTTQDDSYFLAMRIKAYVTDTATPPAEIATPQLTYTLTIASNSIQPDSNPIHIGTIVCNTNKNGGEDFDYPIWVPPSTALSLFMTNLTAATAYNVKVKFCGMRFLSKMAGAIAS